MKVNKTPEIRKILSMTFPDYRGRKFSIRPYDPAKPFQCHNNYWDGGTKSYYVGVNIATGAVVEIPKANPYVQAEGQKGFLAENIMIVEHSYFCGRDCGIIFHVHPNNMRKLVTGGTAQHDTIQASA